MEWRVGQAPASLAGVMFADLTSLFVGTHVSHTLHIKWLIIALITHTLYALIQIK